MSFDQSFDRLIGNEGGYSNNPADPGGETMWGVTARVARENGYAGAMVNMSRDTAKGIYRAEYWAVCRCDELPAAAAYQVFDAAVNHGCGQAIKFLQKAVGTTQDGKIGPQTISATQSLPIPRTLMLYMAARLRFYTSLVNFNSFGRGWTNRGAAQMEYAAQDVT